MDEELEVAVGAGDRRVGPPVDAASGALEPPQDEPGVEAGAVTIPSGGARELRKTLDGGRSRW